MAANGCLLIAAGFGIEEVFLRTVALRKEILLETRIAVRRAFCDRRARVLAVHASDRFAFAGELALKARGAYGSVDPVRKFSGLAVRGGRRR